MRNKYVHGSQGNTDGDDAHFQTDVTALKPRMALVIQSNDGFRLSATEQSEPEDTDRAEPWTYGCHS